VNAKTKRNNTANARLTRFCVIVCVVFFAATLFVLSAVGGLTAGNKLLNETLFNENFDVENSGMNTASAADGSSTGITLNPSRNAFTYIAARDGTNSNFINGWYLAYGQMTNNGDSWGNNSGQQFGYRENDGKGWNTAVASGTNNFGTNFFPSRIASQGDLAFTTSNTWYVNSAGWASSVTSRYGRNNDIGAVGASKNSKTAVFAIAYVRLGGVLKEIAQSGKLRVYFSGRMYAYDSDNTDDNTVIIGTCKSSELYSGSYVQPSGVADSSSDSVQNYMRMFGPSNGSTATNGGLANARDHKDSVRYDSSTGRYAMASDWTSFTSSGQTQHIGKNGGMFVNFRTDDDVLVIATGGHASGSGLVYRSAHAGLDRIGIMFCARDVGSGLSNTPQSSNPNGSEGDVNAKNSVTYMPEVIGTLPTQWVQTNQSMTLEIRDKSGLKFEKKTRDDTGTQWIFSPYTLSASATSHGTYTASPNNGGRTYRAYYTISNITGNISANTVYAYGFYRDRGNLLTSGYSFGETYYSYDLLIDSYAPIISEVRFCTATSFNNGSYAAITSPTTEDVYLVFRVQDYAYDTSHRGSGLANSADAVKVTNINNGEFKNIGLQRCVGNGGTLQTNRSGVNISNKGDFDWSYYYINLGKNANGAYRITVKDKVGNERTTDQANGNFSAQQMKDAATFCLQDTAAPVIKGIEFRAGKDGASFTGYGVSNGWYPSFAAMANGTKLAFDTTFGFSSNTHLNGYYNDFVTVRFTLYDSCYNPNNTSALGNFDYAGSGSTKNSYYFGGANGGASPQYDTIQVSGVLGFSATSGLKIAYTGGGNSYNPSLMKGGSTAYTEEVIAENGATVINHGVGTFYDGTTLSNGAPVQRFSRWVTVYYVLPYKYSAYTFTVTDRAGNTTSSTAASTSASYPENAQINGQAGVTSFAANIDTGAPVITSVTAKARIDGSDIDATNSWVRLAPTIYISMTDSDGSGVTVNNGSGIYSLDVYKIIGYVSDSNHGTWTLLKTYYWNDFPKSVNSFAIPVDSLSSAYNTCDIPRYGFRVRDAAGNYNCAPFASLGSNINFQESSANSAAVYANGQYYGNASNPWRFNRGSVYDSLSHRENKIVELFVDTVAPKIKFSAFINLDGFLYMPSGSNYIYPWTKSTYDIYVVVEYGCSGVTLAESITTRTDANTQYDAGGIKAGMGSTSPGSARIKDSYKTNKSLTNANSTLKGEWYTSVTENGISEYTYTATSGAGLSYNSGKIIARVDKSAPVWNLLGIGFSNSYTNNDYAFGRADGTDNGDGTLRYKAINAIRDLATWQTSASLTLYAFVSLSDELSGVSTLSQSYGWFYMDGTVRRWYNESTSNNLTNPVRYKKIQQSGQACNVNGLEAAGSAARGTVTFSHNGYTYTENLTREYPITEPDTDQNTLGHASYYVYSFSIWTENYLRTAAVKNGVSLGTALNNYLNGASLVNPLAVGAALIYTVDFFDFLSTKSSDTLEIGKNNSAGAAIEYKVDPFKRVASVVDMKVGANTDGTGGTPYRGEWTFKEITIYITKQFGIAPTNVSYIKVALLLSEGGDELIHNSAALPSAARIPADVDDGDSKTARVVFPANSNYYQLAFEIIGAGNPLNVRGASGTLLAAAPQTLRLDEADDPLFYHPWVDNNEFNTERFFIRQDTNPPILKGYFLSTRPDLKLENVFTINSDFPNGIFNYSSPSVAVFYEAVPIDTNAGSYSFVERKNPNSFYSVGAYITKSIISGTLTLTETNSYASGLYLYIIATDNQGDAGMGRGSGIRDIKVTFNGKTETFLFNTFTSYKYVGTNGSDGSLIGKYQDNTTGYEMYVSGAPNANSQYYGYESSVALGSRMNLTFVLTDNQGNGALNEVVAGTSGGVYNVRDAFNNEVDNLPRIDNRAPNLTIKSATYTSGTITNLSYLAGGKFIGDPITSNLPVILSVSNGYSGSTIYVRKRDYGEDVSDVFNGMTFGTPPFSLLQEMRWDDRPYSLTDNGWSDFTFYQEGAERNNSDTPYSYILNNIPVYDRFDFLVVSGTGAVFFFEAGDVFIDAIAPVIHTDMTYFVTESTGVEFDALTEWTNDSVYVYLFVDDYKGSGVGVKDTDDSGVWYGPDSNRIYFEPVIGRGGLTYYRTLITSYMEITVWASDKAGNTVASTDTFTFTPKIDTTEVQYNIVGRVYGETGTGKRADGTVINMNPSGYAYTNATRIDVVITVTYGPSGFPFDVSRMSYNTAVANNPHLGYATIFGLIGPSAVWSHSPSQRESSVAFSITEQQKNTYTIRTYNAVSEQNAKDTTYPNGEARPVGFATMKVAIDRTPPIITSGNLSVRPDLVLSCDGNKSEIEEVWHNAGRVIAVKAEDIDEGTIGSGLNEIWLTYNSGNPLTTWSAMFREDPSDNKLKPYRGDFNAPFNAAYLATLDEFAYYTVTLYDKANNESYFDLRPKIDPNKPLFGASGTAQVVYANGSGTVYDYSWANDDLQALFDLRIFRSGAEIYYLTYQPTNTDWAQYLNNAPDSAWQKYANFTDGTEDLSLTGTSYRELIGQTFLLPYPMQENINLYYAIRIKSASEVWSDKVNLGLIRIDKVAPVFVIDNSIVSYTSGNDTKNYMRGVSIPTNVPFGTLSGNVWTAENFWVSDIVTVAVFNSSTLISGSWFEYSTDGITWTKRNEGQPSSTGAVTFAVYNKTYGGYTWAETLIHNIPSEYGKTYMYRMVTGSNKISAVFSVQGVKRDATVPNVSVEEGSTSFIFRPKVDGKYQEATQAEFEAGTRNYAFGDVFTPKNSVILKINIGAVGASGATLYINNIAHKTFSSPSEGGNDKYVYYVIDATVLVNIRLENNTYGWNLTTQAFEPRPLVSSGPLEKKVNIDNNIPFIFVQSVTGTRSSSWDGTVEESWYVNQTVVVLGIGTIIRTASGYEYSTMHNPSGYQVEYRVNGGSWVNYGSSWTLPLTNLQGTYEFRITSNAGLSYTLGNNAINNEGEIALTAAEIKNILTVQMGGTDLGILGIIGTENAVIRHLNGTDFRYTFNVDTNTYERKSLTDYMGESDPSQRKNVIYVQRLNILTPENVWFEETSLNFASYTIQKSSNGKASGTFTTLSPSVMNGGYKRGDYIRVWYASNVADDYLHSLTLWNGGYLTGTANETAGYFDYKFDGEDLKMVAYFTKLLTVSYSNTVAYLQTQSQLNIVTSASYTYKTETGANRQMSVALTVRTYDKDNVYQEVITEIGWYQCRTSADAKYSSVKDGHAVESFRVKNDTVAALVKYFEETFDNGGNEIANSEINPYTIRSQRDLTYIDKPYWNDAGVELSYRTAHYRVSNDISLTENFTISGEFTGTFDGNNRTITLFGGNVVGNYGLFAQVAGLVKNLHVGTNDVTVKNAASVGILAQTITENGRVESLVVSGNITIDGAVTNANIGGLAGYTSGAIIGTFNAPVVSNVRIIQKAGGSEIVGASIGGLVGKAVNRTLITYAYAYGFVQIDRAGANTAAGIVFGKLENYIDGDFFNNYYLTKATFVNGIYIDSFTSSITDVGLSAIVLSNHSAFVAESGIGAVVAAGKTVRTVVLTKLYSDFNLSAPSYGDGTGTENNVLRLSTAAQLIPINYYLSLNYLLTADIDMTAQRIIAANTEFFGTFDGNGRTLNNFGKNVSVQGVYFGLFGRLNGATVKNIVFNNIKVDITDGGLTDDLYVGLVAGKAASATVTNIIAIGSTDVVANAVHVLAGGLVGQIDGGNIYDVFVLNNLTVKANADARTTAGGIAAVMNGTRIGSFTDYSMSSLGVDRDGAVFALGRAAVVTNKQTAVGSIAGTSTGFDVKTSANKVFAIEGNVFINGAILDKTVATGAGVNVGFVTAVFSQDVSAMRSTRFANNAAGAPNSLADKTDVFKVVFSSGGTKALYPLIGLGTVNNKFIINGNVEYVAAGEGQQAVVTGEAVDYKHIDTMLYACYNVKSDIDFSAGGFITIGEGLIFTGSIDGTNENSWEAEGGSVSSLFNASGALVYRNHGKITDLGVNVFYTANVTKTGGNYDLVFGAIAIYNKGTVRNVTVGGSVTVNAAVNATVVVSGFVGIDEGGIVYGATKLQNSISGLEITVTGALTVYAGGYIGIISGMTAISYGIGSGTIRINGCINVNAGTVAGEDNFNLDWEAIENTVLNYQYLLYVDGLQVMKLYGNQP